MAMVIVTNHALKKLSEHGLSEKYVHDVLNAGKEEKVNWGGGTSVIKKYAGYEVGVNYAKEGKKIKVISVWKRNRR